ncbi:unnamed protein product, partial [Amoebophrya sp. A120]
SLYQVIARKNSSLYQVLLLKNVVTDLRGRRNSPVQYLTLVPSGNYLQTKKQTRSRVVYCENPSVRRGTRKARRENFTMSQAYYNLG